MPALMLLAVSQKFRLFHSECNKESQREQREGQLLPRAPYMTFFFDDTVCSRSLTPLHVSTSRKVSSCCFPEAQRNGLTKRLQLKHQIYFVRTCETDQMEPT